MKKLFLTLLLSLFLVFNAWAVSGTFLDLISSGSASLSTPTYSAGTYTHHVENWTTTNTVAFTPVSGSKRCFIVFSANRHAETVSGITFDGNAMALINSISSGADDSNAVMYYYCTDSGTSEINIVITFSGLCSNAAWVAQFDGCNTSSLIDTNDTTSVIGANPQRITNSVTTSTNNCLLISGVMTVDDSVTYSVCSTTGQTLFTDVSETGTMTINGGYFDLSTAGGKDQCFESNVTWRSQLAITGALKPNGS